MQTLRLHELVRLTRGATLTRAHCEKMAFRVASALLNGFVLQAGTAFYRLAEVEFYYTEVGVCEH
jgi:hypothetical protein